VVIPDTVCEGVFLNGVLGIASLPGSTLSWFRNDTPDPSFFINNGSALNPIYNTSGTTYLFEISDKGCISPPLSVPLFFFPRPDITASANPTTGDAPLEVAFTASFTPSNVSTFQWDFDDDGATSSDQNPLYTFEDSGTYVVRLIGISTDGCRDTATVDVVVDQIVEKIIPNIFTPNGDAGNNAFRFQLRASDFTSFNAVIFDRWGKKITEFTSVNDSWDGGDYPAGTYYYVIEATLKDGSKFTPASGFFKLMR
jgi:gliding motility-associated-like protein